MLALTAPVLFQLALLSGGPTSYELAYQQASAYERPLLVLVGAEWCPGCRTMKHAVLPRIAGQGALSAVSYVAIDSDSEPDLAGQLMRGGSIPQLIVFSRKADGDWHREQITGATSEVAVQSLIARAVAVQGSDSAE